MQRAGFSSIRFAPMLSILIVPACFSLPKADVSTHVIDDFAEDASPSLFPTWGAFTKWMCSAIVIPDPNDGNGGSDGGPALDAGQPTSQDGGPPVSCAVGLGDGADYQHALAATFDLPAPIGTSSFGVMVATYAMPDAVDLTGFKTLRFNSRLYSTSLSTAVIPSVTTLGVELGCPTTTTAGETIDFVADRKNTGIRVEAPWGDPIKLNLYMDFSLKPSKGTTISSCLQRVDSIRFIVTPPPGTEPIAGTLLIEGLEVTTD